ncbi:MAG: ABC transporter permease [Deltaproteobacteria bacterium]|nr:ABC transporter permease [Deltaproteobacteria bacterium]
MSDIQDFLVPVIELIGVMIAAVVLVSLLVGGLVAVLRRYAAFGAFGSYQTLLALRILVGYRKNDGGFWERVIPVSGQNFIAMMGTAIGVWALIVVLSVMGGFEADLKGKIVRFSPHLTVHPAGDAGANALDRSVSRSLEDTPHVTTVETFVQGEAMLTSLTNMSPGMKLHGLDPAGRLADLWLDPVVSGRTLDAFEAPVRVMSDREMGFRVEAEAPAAGDGADVMPAIDVTPRRKGRILPGIILGEELARSLSVSVGDQVTAVIPNGDVGPMGVRPRTRSFRVVGTFVSGMYEYDLKMAYLTQDDARDLFMLGGANRVAIMLDDLDDLEAVSGLIREKASGLGLGEVRTVAQANRSLFTALKIEKLAMFLVLGLVILVAAFNVFGSLVLITLEKTRDIAVIRCLGATRKGVRRLFLTIGGTIGFVGTLAGLVLGLGSCGYVAWTGIRLPSEYYLRNLPVEVRPDEIALVVLAALGAALLATLYPASSAAGLSPSDGLRND